MATLATPAPAGERRLSLWTLCGLALIIGIIGGLGAVVFRDLIGFIHNVLFYGHFSTAYDARVFSAPSAWGALIILVPVLGSFGVTYLVVNFAPEAKGHGVPEVIEAIYYEKGIIRPVVAGVKSVASALAIGSGAAVGREGPIIQIGATFGSVVGQVLRLQTGQRVTLVAAGAGAGIAATFNTPIGGVLFATELMLPELTVDTFLPFAIATGTATYVARLFFGVQPAFSIPTPLDASATGSLPISTLALYAVLGLLTGFAAAASILGLDRAETLFEKIPGAYVRHAIGMLMVGLLMYGFMEATGHYYVEGVGYSTIQSLLQGTSYGFGFLLVLFAAKLLAFTLSLGSGSSGGVFSPSLYMGATLGAAVATLAGMAGMTASIPAFAIVGMGAMVGSGTGAAMTAITMIFEMTRDWNIVVPMVIAVSLAIGTRRLVCPETIYTLKLVLRGKPVPGSLQANMFLLRNADHLMDRAVLTMDASSSLDSLAETARANPAATHVVATNGSEIVGVLRLDESFRRLTVGENPAVLRDLVPRDAVVVDEAERVSVVLGRFRHGATTGVVLRQGRNGANEVVGVITKNRVADAIAEDMRDYA